MTGSQSLPSSVPLCPVRQDCRRAHECDDLDAALAALPTAPSNVLDFARPAIRRQIDLFARAVAASGGAACCAALDVPDMKRAVADDDLPGVLESALETAQALSACSSHCAGLPQALSLIALLRSALEMRRPQTQNGAPKDAA